MDRPPYYWDVAVIPVENRKFHTILMHTFLGRLTTSRYLLSVNYLILGVIFNLIVSSNMTPCSLVIMDNFFGEIICPLFGIIYRYSIVSWNKNWIYLYQEIILISPNFCYLSTLHFFKLQIYLKLKLLLNAQVNLNNYIYWTVHNLNSWLKIEQHDVIWFIIAILTAQHISNISTFETCVAVIIEIIKQVTWSWSTFIQNLNTS